MRVQLPDLRGRLRRRKRSRGHPTPKQAFAALEQGDCLYSPLTKCSGKLRSVGIRGEQDVSAVLVCRAHFGALRRMPEREADKLERVLREAFGR